MSLQLHHLQRRSPQRVSKCGICVGAQASTRLTGAATSFLTWYVGFVPLTVMIGPGWGDFLTCSFSTNVQQRC